jgi:hypothetical protein
MNELRHPSALLYNSIKVFIRVSNKFINRFLVCEYAVFFFILEDTEVWLSGHQESLLYDVYKAETKEIKRNVHEIRRTIRHQSEDRIVLASYDLGVHGLGDVLLNHSLVVCLLHVKVLSLSDELVGKSRGHQLFVFVKHIEELLSEDGEVLLLKKL